MKKHITKRRAVFAAIVVVALAIASGVAFAYFSSSGTGTGSAAVGSSTGIVLSSDNVSGLYPGGSDVTVAVHVNNPGSGNEYVNQISGAVADNGTCLGTWFQVDPIAFAQNVTHGATVNTSTKVRMLDSGSNQDACQGKTMTINWSSN